MSPRASQARQRQARSQQAERAGDERLRDEKIGSALRGGPASGPAPAGRSELPKRGLGFVGAFGAAALACWRVSHLVAREDGPFDIVLRARARAGTSVVGRLLDCPLCVSVWAAAPLAAWAVHRGGGRRSDVIPVWLALSGAASALELSLPSTDDAFTDDAFTDDAFTDDAFTDDAFADESSTGESSTGEVELVTVLAEPLLGPAAAADRPTSVAGRPRLYLAR